MTTREQPLRVVYLAGSGHTGSTLLALFLDAHPKIVSVGETSFKPVHRRAGRTDLMCTCGESYLTCDFWQQIFRGVSNAGYDFGPDAWSNDFRYDGWLTHRLLSRYSVRPALRIVQRIADVALPVHRQRIRRVRDVNVAFVRTLLDVAGADVFFDTSKRAMRLHHLLQTPQLEVSVVRLVRDVRAYVWSAKKRGEVVNEAALTWRKDQDAFDRLVRRLPADRVMLLRYEDACGDPQTWLKRTYAFCGVDAIDPPEVVVSREHHVLGNKMRLSEKIKIRLDESWREGLSGEEMSQALSIAGHHHSALGYVAH